MQTLNVQVNIPPEYSLITKEEHKRLMSEELKGQYWLMKDLEKRTGRSAQWLKNHILEDPVLKKEVAEFTKFPERRGSPYIFKASEWAEWLENNERVVFG